MRMSSRETLISLVNNVAPIERVSRKRCAGQDLCKVRNRRVYVLTPRRVDWVVSVPIRTSGCNYAATAKPNQTHGETNDKKRAN